MLTFDDGSPGAVRTDLSSINADSLDVSDPLTTRVSLTVNGVSVDFVSTQFARLFVQDQPAREQVLVTAAARLPLADGDEFSSLEFFYDAAGPAANRLDGYSLDNSFDILLTGEPLFAGSFEFGKDIPDAASYDTRAFGAFSPGRGSG